MSETDEAPEVAAEEQETPETEAAVAVDEPEAAAPAEDAPEAEAPAEEPVAEAEPEVAEEEAPAEEPEAELEVEADVPVALSAPARQAKILLCERGHRTAALWSSPTVCHARPTRHGPECGRQLYPIGELPEQVQKALNPLKASKKASKG